jgi:hypothetical protein
MSLCRPAGRRLARRTVLHVLSATAVTICAHGWAGEAEPVPSVLGPIPQVRPLLVESVICYVNDDIITGNEVIARSMDRWSEARRTGRPLPQDKSEMTAWHQASLDLLVDEALLLQKGRELKIDIDRDRLGAEILARAKREGRALTLLELSEALRWSERSRIVDMVLGFFEERAAQPTPAELLAEYRSRADEYRLSPCAAVQQIALPVTTAAEIDELRAAQAAILKQAQSAADPAILAAAETCIGTFIAADPAEQQRLLDGLMTTIAGRQGAADLPAGDTKLVAGAVGAVARMAARRSADRAIADLAAIATRLSGRSGPDLVDAFRSEASALGQVNADLGEIEPGSLHADIDAAVFAGPVGAIRPPLVIGPRAVLLLVASRQDGRMRTFDEVVGNLDTRRMLLRQGLVRSAVVASLRAKASIRPGQLTVSSLVE